MRFPLLFLLAAALPAEERTLALPDAVALALKQNPAIILARLEQQKAALAARVARDPFFPKAFIGSGMAYTSGFPMSIEGAAPSIVQAKGIASLFNKPLSHRVAQTAEQARAAAIDIELRQNEIAHQTALLYIDAARWERAAGTLHRQVESLEKAGEAIRQRVAAGRELEIEAKRSALAIARARQRTESLEQQRDYAAASLALVLGFGPEDRVRPVSGEPAPLSLPESEQASIASALDQSRELKRIESAILAKGHEIRSHQAARLPTADLVAQYGLFARFNNYEDFFRKFQRHNWQLGVALQLPLLPSRASQAQAAQGDIEVIRLKTQLAETRGRITVETQRSYRQVAVLDRAREVARLELDVARDQVGILLAQLEEGRATVHQLEESRAAEQDRWIEYFDAQFALERARLELLKHTGTLVAALR
ncbi:MAG: TolC family protein [Bryobacteraceae bacterium]|nr:TolC family protein [Bryobacteraceae bacterium]